MNGASVEGFELEQVDDLGAIRSEWRALAQRSGNVFGTWEWADAWHRIVAPEATLRVALLRRGDGSAAAILPLCAVRERPLRLLRLVGAGPSDQLGPICAPQDQPAAMSAMRAHAEHLLGGAGVFLAERLWGADNLAAPLAGVTVRHLASPVLPIEGRTFDEFLASRSRNFREQVRRRARRVERLGAEYRLTTDPGRLAEDMHALIGLHTARWGDGGSTVFAGRGTAFHLEFARRALEEGWLRLWTMTIGGAPVAAWYGLRYAGVESYYQAGRDPEYEHLDVGFVLLCHSIQVAFADGVREYRFGSGGEPYKYRFAEQDPGLETVALAAGLRGRLAVAAVRAALRAPKRAQLLARRALGGRGEPL